VSACADYAAEQWELDDHRHPEPSKEEMEGPALSPLAEAVSQSCSARYSGTCAVCGRPILRGQAIRFAVADPSPRRQWHLGCNPHLTPAPEPSHISSEGQVSVANAPQPGRPQHHDSHSTANNEAGCGLSPYQGGNPQPAFLVFPLPVQVGAPGRTWTEALLAVEACHADRN